jgi:hypothetical protein
MEERKKKLAEDLARKIDTDEWKAEKFDDIQGKDYLVTYA